MKFKIFVFTANVERQKYNTCNKRTRGRGRREEFEQRKGEKSMQMKEKQQNFNKGTNPLSSMVKRKGCGQGKGGVERT